LPSCTGCGVQKHCTLNHAGGRASDFVAPISDCVDFDVLRTTEKNFGKQFWDFPKY